MYGHDAIGYSCLSAGKAKVTIESFQSQPGQKVYQVSQYLKTERMKRVLLNLTKIQDGWKIQLVKEIRDRWGKEKTSPGKRVAFYEDEDGRIIVEPLD